jgi:hypothetical protein
MSKSTPNADKVNPGVTVSAPMDKSYQQTTAGHHSKSEEHFRKIVDSAVNRDGADNVHRNTKGRGK